MPSNIPWTYVAIGAAVGYFVLPRVVGFVMGKVAATKVVAVK